MFEKYDTNEHTAILPENFYVATDKMTPVRKRLNLKKKTFFFKKNSELRN